MLWCVATQLSTIFVSFETYFSVLLQNFMSPDFLSFDCLLLNYFEILIEFDTVKNPAN